MASALGTTLNPQLSISKVDLKMVEFYDWLNKLFCSFGPLAPVLTKSREK